MSSEEDISQLITVNNNNVYAFDFLYKEYGKLIMKF